VTATLSPTAWLYLRTAGRRFQQWPDDTASRNLRTEIEQARAEGATTEEIASAARLSVAMVEAHSN
jgi:hypothetical protein